MVKNRIARLLVAVLLVSLCMVGATGNITASAAETSGDYEYEIVNGKAVITAYTGSDSSLDIPSMIEGYQVTRIDNYVFSGCTFLTSVAIPDCVTSIGEQAFWNCNSLESVYITNLAAWSSIQFGYVGNPFYYAKNLYLNGDAVTDVVIPDGVTDIGDYAFFNCDFLKTITIPDSVTNIGLRAFNGCDSLTTITIPNDVTTIREGTFSTCDLLESITIPESVMNIEKGAFYKCNALSTVYYKGSSETSQAITIGGENSLTDATWFFNSCIGSANHTYTNACDSTCDVCTATRNITHTYKTTTTKATLTKNGSVVKKCAVCGDVASNTAIKYPKTIKLSATSYTYDGKVKTPTVTVKDSAGKTLKKGTDYTVTYASGRKNAGTYKVTVKMIGKYSGTKTLSFKINPIKVEKLKLKLSATSYTYDGKAKTPTVSVKTSSGKTLKKGTDYTVTYASGRKNAGSYKVIAKMKGNYSGSKTLTFKINPIKIAKCEVKFKNNNKITYSPGKTRVPTVIVKNASGKTLKEGTDYMVVRVKACKTIGNHKVTVKMKGNYTGSKTLKFDIVPDKASKITVTNQNGGLTVKWNATKGATGYKVELKKSYPYRASSAIKTVDTKTRSVTFKDLKVGTKYHVYITAYTVVNGKKLYSTEIGYAANTAVPAKPKVKASNGKDSIKLTWNKVKDADCYEVFKWSPGSQLPLMTYVEGLEYEDVYVTNGSIYYYQVRAVKKKGDTHYDGEFSDKVKIKKK